jgi:hypothetical protein
MYICNNKNILPWIKKIQKNVHNLVVNFFNKLDKWRFSCIITFFITHKTNCNWNVGKHYRWGNYITLEEKPHFTTCLKWLKVLFATILLQVFKIVKPNEYVMYVLTNKINTMTQALNHFNYKMIQISQLDRTLNFELRKAYWIALLNSS